MEIRYLSLMSSQSDILGDVIYYGVNGTRATDYFMINYLSEVGAQVFIQPRRASIRVIAFFQNIFLRNYFAIWIHN